MARPREFDADRALESAMRTFWAKGYETTSIDDLCAATGLSRSSLYAAFGDKRSLLLRSLDRYQARTASFFAETLGRPAPIRDALAAFLDELIDRIVEGPGRRGCFIGNCAAELDRGDRKAIERVRRGLAGIEAEFRGALARAQARGEIARDADLDALARFFTATTQGMRLVGKVNPDRAALEDIKDVMLRCLDN